MSNPLRPQVERYMQGGRLYVRVEIEWEGDAEAGAEIALQTADRMDCAPALAVPSVGEVISTWCELEDGSASTVQPSFGISSGYSHDTADHLFTIGSAAAFVYSDERKPYVAAPGRRLFVRPNPNTAADNSVRLIILIGEGIHS